MLVTISGYTGRDIKFTQVPADDGNSTCTVTDTAVAVKVAADTTDWYLVKFADDALVKASKYITKGLLISVTGELTFEDWTDEQHGRRSKPVVTVSDLQLTPKSRA
jgi:single-stranded DNA-binding protein